MGFSCTQLTIVAKNDRNLRFGHRIDFAFLSHRPISD